MIVMKKMFYQNRLNSQNNQAEKAQGMVEFALVLPILLLLAMGIIEFGRLLFIFSAVNTASSEAVRYGSAVDDTGGTARYVDCTGIEEAAFRIGSLVNLSSVTISYDEGPGGATISKGPPWHFDCVTLFKGCQSDGHGSPRTSSVVIPYHMLFS